MNNNHKNSVALTNKHLVSQYMSVSEGQKSAKIQLRRFGSDPHVSHLLFETSR